MSRPAPPHGMLLLSIGALGVSCVLTQLALMRELLAAFYGNEMVLGLILGNWLLLMGVGAWLGKWGRKLGEFRGVFLLAQILVAGLPMAQVIMVRGLRNMVFVRGATPEIWETILAIMMVLMPFCLVAGFLLTLASAQLGERNGASAIRGIYVADSLGSLAGGLLFSFVLIHFFDHFALLCFPALLNLQLAGWQAWRWQKKSWLCATAALAASLLGLLGFWNVDARSTAWQYPAQTILFRGNSPYGRLVVTEYAGQFNFYENGLPMFSSYNLEQTEETVHYAMAQRPDAKSVLLISGGVSGTAREILKYGVAEVVYVELDPLLIALGRRYLPANLADPRIKVVATDGRLFLKQTDLRFEVVLVDLPDPSTAQLNRFFTDEFYAEAKRVLAKDGVLSFGLARYENFVSPELARLLASAHRTVKTAFQNTKVLPGGRVFFLASDGPLFTDIAGRLKQHGLRPRLVNEHYLKAMFSANRLAAVGGAVGQAAGVNRDFNPVLYYYHWRHWLSQFTVRFGGLAALLAVALGIYLWRLKAVPLTVFASGFTAAALEIVLLLAFQACYGALYQQLGIIVTLFMTGLAVGAFLVRFVAPGRSRQMLLSMAVLLAIFACLLPFALPWLGQLTSAGAVYLAIPALTLMLAVIAGAEFLLAAQAESPDVAVTAARLYSADFAGACLGALLSSALLIPLLGATAVCLLCAGLNLIGVAALKFGKAPS